MDLPDRIALGQPGLTPALIFSKDWAMQLEALLASLFRHCRDGESLWPMVLYTCSGRSAN